jgi:hypothetical protein
MCPLQLAETAIESAEEQVPGFAGDLKQQAVGEPQRRLHPEVLERSRYDVWILQGKVLMLQKHFDGSRNLLRTQVVDCGKNPGCLGQSEV